jgi:hypothetical protein
MGKLTIKEMVEGLSTVAECENLMRNATAQKRPDVYNLALRRKLKLLGITFADCRHPNDDPIDPLVIAFYEMLAGREELLRQKHHGKRQQAGYTRRMVKAHGVMHCLIEWAKYEVGESSSGFDDFVAAGMLDKCRGDRRQLC